MTEIDQPGGKPAVLAGDNGDEDECNRGPSDDAVACDNGVTHDDVADKNDEAEDKSVADDCSVADDSDVADDLEGVDIEGGNNGESSKSEEKPNEKEEDFPFPSTSGQCASPTGSCDMYEGDNLIPMVKTVKVEAIRYVAKPNRVDMQHLKEVMLQIILRAIEDRENQLQSEGVNSPRGSVSFRDVLTELFNTDNLHYRTREDLTVQMSFLCLLTLANENSFNLTNELGGTEDLVISFFDDPN